MEIKGEDGRYDDDCEKVLHRHDANMVMLVVVNGDKGHGISVCINADLPHAKDLAKGIPKLLRQLAETIEKRGSYDLNPSKPSKSWADLEKGEDEHDE